MMAAERDAAARAERAAAREMAAVEEGEALRGELEAARAEGAGRLRELAERERARVAEVEGLRQERVRAEVALRGACDQVRARRVGACACVRACLMCICRRAAGFKPRMAEQRRHVSCVGDGGD